VKYDLDKNKKFLFKNSQSKYKPNLINEYYLSEYIDLSEEIEFLLYEVDFVNNKNMTKDLHSREINLISRFYNMTKNYSTKRNKQYEDSLVYYNSISMVILSMLTGGIIGVIIIIYFSFKSNKTLENIYSK